MATKADPPGSAFASCSQCGAERQVAARYCWMCGAAQDSMEQAAPAAIVAEMPTGERNQRVAIWIGVVVVAIIGFGLLAAQDWIWATHFAIAVVPTLLVVLIGTTSARSRGQPWTPVKTTTVAVATAATTVVSTIAIVIIAAAAAVLVLLAAMIALFEQCLRALGGGSQ